MPHPHAGLAARYRTALITGASSGIGKAVAARLVEEGLTVYGTTRRPDAPGLDSTIRWLAFDGSTPAGLAAFIKDQSELLTSIDFLINNAGGSCFGAPDDLPEAAISAQHQLLLETPVQLVRAVLPGMRQRRAGAVVNVSSLASLFPLPYMPDYSACKAGLSAYTESLIVSERGSGIVLIDFRPGDYRTAFNANTARYGKLTGRKARAWRKLEAHLEAAPEPDRAAADLVKALRRGRSGTVHSGGFFQARLAVLAARLLPRSWLLAVERRYYDLGGQ